MATAGTANKPAGLKHDRPHSGLVGWAAAWSILDKIGSDAQRDELSRIVRNLGVQGVPALSYAASFARWEIGEGDYMPPPKKLDGAVRKLIEERVRWELAELGREAFPKLRLH